MTQTTETVRDWNRGALIDVSDCDFDTQLKLAGLDWSVDVSPFRYGLQMQHQSTKQKAAYRGDNGQFIDIYTTRRPWQNKDILHRFWQFCDAGGLTVDRLGYVKGEVIAMAAFKATGLQGDATENWIVLRDSHMNGRGLMVALFRNRLACTNAWRRHIKGSSRTISHVGQFDAGRISGVLEASLQTVAEIDRTETRLAETVLTDEQAHLQLIKAFGHPGKPIHEQPQIVQDVLNLYQGQGQGSSLPTAFNTAYGLLQSVTEYYNWHQQSKDPVNTFMSVLNGSAHQRMNKFNQQLVSVYCN
jgi:Domain of unknown function (DUF932)